MSKSLERTAPDASDRAGRVRRRRPGWNNADVLRTAALVIAMYVLVRLVWFAHLLLLVAFLGVLFGLAVSSGVTRLEKVGVGRGLGAAAIVIAFFGVLVGFGAWLAPTIHDQSVELRRRLPDAMDRVNVWVNARQNGVVGLLLGGLATEARADSVPAAPGAPPTVRDRVTAGFGGATRYLFPFISSTAQVVTGFVIIVFLSIYIAVDPELYRRGMLALVPRARRARAGDVLTAIAAVLRRWLATQFLAMITLGAVTTLLLALLGVRAALALGLLAGLLEFIPTVGPIVSSLPAIAMGFLDSPEKALWVAVAYVAVHFAESHMLIPLLMKGGINLPPALTIFAQALMALLFGFVGLMCAVPLLAAVMTAVRMLYVQGVVNDPSTG